MLDRAPLNAPTYRAEGVIVVFGGLGLLAVIVSASAREPGFAALMGVLAVLMVAIGAVWLLWQGSTVARRVRVESVPGGLRFIPSIWVYVLFPILGICGLLPGAVALGFAAAGIGVMQEGSVSRLGPYGVSLIALVALGHQLWVLRRPSGLTLTETGLSGVRGGPLVEVSWDDLSRVSVVASPSAKLVLTPWNTSGLVIDPRWIGSDPNEVAAIIDYYREHPRDRRLLADPRAAIRRVEDSVAR